MGNHKKNDMNVIMSKKPTKQGGLKKLAKSKQYKRASSVPLRNNNIEYDLNSVDSNSHSNRSTSPSLSMNSNNENENLRNGLQSHEFLNEASSKELLRHLQAEYTQLVLEHYEVTKRILNCVDENVRGVSLFYNLNFYPFIFFNCEISKLIEFFSKFIST
jgi:hypothetical protein